MITEQNTCCGAAFRKSVNGKNRSATSRFCFLLVLLHIGLACAVPYLTNWIASWRSISGKRKHNVLEGVCVVINLSAERATSWSCPGTCTLGALFVVGAGAICSAFAAMSCSARGPCRVAPSALCCCLVWNSRKSGPVSGSGENQRHINEELRGRWLVRERNVPQPGTKTDDYRWSLTHDR